MEKELIIRIDTSNNIEKILDFFEDSEFDVEVGSVDSESMSGHVVKIQCIRIKRSEKENENQ